VTGTHPAGGDRSPATEQRMQVIAAELADAGWHAQVNQTAGCLDITASVSVDGGKPVEVIVDEDLYAEIRWWYDPGAAPAMVADVITRALIAITGQRS
jgi:hypothetical protein